MMPTNVHISAALMVSLVLAATVVAHVEVGEVGEYLEKRSQEARHKNHVGPLHDLVNTATRLTAGGLCWVMKHICKRGLLPLKLKPQVWKVVMIIKLYKIIMASNFNLPYI
uniref:Uncharacterized protein n=1 Tax=Oryza meridionalis TaxID=40149 RepID=A0A0E0EP91_9ORYZ